MQGLPLRWRLKLIVLISLSIHMMTSQGRICAQCVTSGLHGKEFWMCTKEYTVEKCHLYAQCVTNGLHRKEIWMCTKKEFTVEKCHLCVQCVINGLQHVTVWIRTVKDTLEKTCIHVLSVRNVLHLRPAWIAIWIFMQVNTSAQNVADVVPVVST